LEALPKVAFRVAVSFAIAFGTVTRNWALVLPAAMVTDAGIGRLELLLARRISILLETGALIITEQVEAFPGRNVLGLHDNDTRFETGPAEMLITPFLTLIGTSTAPSDTAVAVTLIWRNAAIAPTAGFAVTTATSPSPMVDLVKPHAMHVVRPGLLEQESVLPAAVTAEPALTLIALKSSP
jgi:hypothetical protein